MTLEKFKTSTELQDLKTVDTRWEGILSPMYTDEVVQQFIHEQFLDGADTYVRRYQNLDYWRFILTRALDPFDFNTDDELHILDIGSGAGNTIFPMMEMFPKSNIAATDLSLPLLKALKDYYDENYANHSCIVVQQNAEDMVFEENSIDLVTGGAILHHLYSPEKTIEQCYKVLRPGGIAVFFEPFELGHQILAVLLTRLIDYNNLLKRTQANAKRGDDVLPLISDDVIDFFKAINYDIHVRKGSNKEDPIFQQIDDKWLFTRGYFEDMGKSMGFSEVIVFPIYGRHARFTQKMDSLLRVGMEKTKDVLPQWVLDYMAQEDQRFSEEAWDEIFVEGTVIFKK